MTTAETATSRLSFARSVWAATCDPAPSSPVIEPDSHYDVIVVGGGIAGAVATLTLSLGGARVALLEAFRLASGATGRSGGFIVPAFPILSPRTVLQALGSPGEQLVSAVADSADCLFDLVREHRIDCAAGQMGWFQPTFSSARLKEFEADAETWRQFGGKLTVLDGLETERQTGMPGYSSSCLLDSGGTIHPVRLVHGLVRTAIAHGARYLEHTPVLSIQRRDGRWYVEASDLTVSAEKVLVCTNGRSPTLTPGLHRSLVPAMICQSATHPIAGPNRKHLLGQGSCLSDTQVNLFTYRFDPEWRLISGGFPLLPARDGRFLGSCIARRLRKALQIANRVHQEFVWFGQASVTEDFLPRACEIGPGAYTFTACNGRGLAMSTVFAHRFSKAILNNSFGELPIPLGPPQPFRRRALARLGTRLYPLYGSIADRISRSRR